MAYLGKVYTLERDENFDAFLKAVGMPDEVIAKYLSFKPTTKLEKDGDTYIYTNLNLEGPKETKFKSGVPFDDVIQGSIPIKSTYTVDGNIVTQVVESDGKGTGTFKREYDGDSLKVTMSTDRWDGVAYRYYKA